MELESEDAVDSFLRLRANATVVLGLFGSRSSDEYADWLEAAEDITMRSDIYLANVAPPLQEVYMGKPHLWFTMTERQRKKQSSARQTGVSEGLATPVLVLFRPVPEGRERGEEERATLQLATLTEGSIERWIDSNRIPACGELDAATFSLYERLGLPMLLLFLSGDDAESTLSHSGGTAMPAEEVKIKVCLSSWQCVGWCVGSVWVLWFLQAGGARDIPYAHLLCDGF